MARQPRYTIPEQPQHVIIRGNNRAPVFYADQDYQLYLERLKQACEKHNCDVHAYVLMTNHIHCVPRSGGNQEGKKKPHAVVRMRDWPLGLGFQEPGSNRS